MANISKFNASAFSMPAELTVAAANFNFDFSLMKVDAPPEFHGLRDALSQSRRKEAEDGQHHVTARKLGSLFEAKVPEIPNLIKAYGNRVSEISSRSMTGTKSRASSGIFADHLGIDGTGIWAAATSGKAAFAVHLLACMLARIWKSHEAISLWIKIIECRKDEINDGFSETGMVQAAAVMAAKQAISRQQLASWDASARAWLQTADADRRYPQTQLMLIINNLSLPVNANKDSYESVLGAWTSGMQAMERLVQGMPQQTQNGAVLLAISSWHLYPDMKVLMSTVKDVELHDSLMNGALLTISAHAENNKKEGVFWSLPLTRMRYYSPLNSNNSTERRLALDTSRVSISEFWIIILGAILSQWKTHAEETEEHISFVVFLSNLVNRPVPTVPWLKYLADAAENCLSGSNVHKDKALRLLRLGMKHCHSFLNDPKRQPPQFFGLVSFSVLFGLIDGVEDKIAILRRIAKFLGSSGQNLLIKYTEPNQNKQRHDLQWERFASALPMPSVVRGYCWYGGEPDSKRQRRMDTVRHRRTVVVNLSDSGCGSSCGCVTQNGPACVCHDYGGGCSTCHIGLDLQCRYPSNRACLCDESFTLDQKCVECNLDHYISSINSYGEDCIVLHGHKYYSADNRRFVLNDNHHRNDDTWESSASNFDDAAIFQPNEIRYRNDNTWEFLAGNLDDAAIFKSTGCNVLRYVGTGLASLATFGELDEAIRMHPMDSQRSQKYFSAAAWDEQQGCSLRALAFATELYKPLEGATLSLETIKTPLYKTSWARQIDREVSTVVVTQAIPMKVSGVARVSPTTKSADSGLSTPPDSHNERSIKHVGDALDTTHDEGEGANELAVSFACLAMFESGEFDIDLKSLEGVMALSTGDSIYVASSLISDPCERTEGHPIYRIFGNLGRADMALLISPPNLQIKDFDLGSWHMINHFPFDGKFEDKFGGLSLHLSFTDYELPVDIGTRGLRDALVTLVETVISIYDKGKHIGDIDILATLKNSRLMVQYECQHQPNDGQREANGKFEKLTSIESWEELVDFLEPSRGAVVKTTGNWQARLAVAAASLQLGRGPCVLPRQPCLRCLESLFSDHDVFIA